MTDDRLNRTNRLILLTIIGLPVTMILTATWLWYYVVNGHLDLVGALGTANRGHLVQPPRQLDQYALSDTEGAVRFADLPPKWTLVVANGGAKCAAACEQKLYLTRQIHVAIGRDYNRIGRLFLSETSVKDAALAMDALSDGAPLPASFAEYLAQQHKDATALTLPPGGMAALFPEVAQDETTWYLVDPAGWVMMSYNSDVSYKDVIADLKFLLKNSSE